MFHRLGTLVSRHWLLVILGWLLLAAAVRWYAPRWDDVTHDGDLAYLPATMPSAQGERLFAEAFPEQEAKSRIVVVLARRDRRLMADDYDLAEKLAQRLEQAGEELGVAEIWTRDTDVIGKKLRSPDRRALLLVLHMRSEFMAVDNVRVLRRVQEMADAVRQESIVATGLELGITGSAAIGGDMLASASESIKNTEATTILLVIVILLVVYRAPLLALLPLVTIGVSVVVAMGLVALLTQADRLPGMEWWNFKVFTTTKIFIVVILFGAGTDFCLFLIARYREELGRGLTSADAASEALSNVAGALTGSALTTILGLATMFFADFGKFRNSGPAIALCLAVTLCASLTLAPALLRACGRFLFWPRMLHSQQLSGSGRDFFQPFWNWAATGIVSRPGLILLLSLAILLPLGYLGFEVETTHDLLNELQPDRTSVRGTALLRRHFPPGEVGPVTVLAFQSGGQFDTRRGKDNIADFSELLDEMPGVDSVRSLSQPLGDPMPPGLVSALRGGRGALAASETTRAKQTYLTQVPDLRGTVTRFDLLLSKDPFSKEAIELLNNIDLRLARIGADQGSAWHKAQFYFTGTTAGTRDLKTITASDQWRIEQLVVLAVLAVLIVLVRQPVVCLYLIVSVLLSYFVTLGITEAFFSWTYGATYHGLDWKVPIFLFVILVAVGEDYNIYLITRVLEEQKRHAPLEGLRVAVARTGGIITSCGLIMAGTFISMMTGTLRGVRELGFALSFGVMLDTLVVRPILVPAFLALWHRHWHKQERNEERSPEAVDRAVANAR